MRRINGVEFPVSSCPVSNYPSAEMFGGELSSLLRIELSGGVWSIADLSGVELIDAELTKAKLSDVELSCDKLSDA